MAGNEADVHGSDQHTDADVEEREYTVHNYHCAWMTFVLLMMFFSDSVALLIMHSYSRVKYAYVVLLFLAKICAILTEKLAFEALQNRCFNNFGKAGGNVPLDLRMEHLKKLLKIALEQLTSNITDASAQRVAKSLSTLEKVLSMIDSDCNLGPRSGYHSSKNLEETVVTITKVLHDINEFEIQPVRSYNTFKGFKRNLLHKLDYREFHSWASKLFYVWQTMYHD